jgi:hypothetical protein
MRIRRSAGDDEIAADENLEDQPEGETIEDEVHSPPSS